MAGRLSRRDVETLVFATVLLPLASLAVHVAGFRRVHRVLTLVTRAVPRRLPIATAVTCGRRIAAMVTLASARTSLLPADCLPRSLVLWWLCRRARLDAAFRLGARTLTGRFEAHAWVEVAGVPVGEEEAVDQIYTAFDLAGAPPGEAPS